MIFEGQHLEQMAGAVQLRMTQTVLKVGRQLVTAAWPPRP